MFRRLCPSGSEVARTRGPIARSESASAVLEPLGDHRAAVTVGFDPVAPPRDRHRAGRHVPGDLVARLEPHDRAGGGPASPARSVAAPEPRTQRGARRSVDPDHLGALGRQTGHAHRVPDHLPHRCRALRRSVRTPRPPARSDDTAADCRCRRRGTHALRRARRHRVVPPIEPPSWYLGVKFSRPACRRTPCKGGLIKEGRGHDGRTSDGRGRPVAGRRAVRSDPTAGLRHRSRLQGARVPRPALAVQQHGLVRAPREPCGDAASLRQYGPPARATPEPFDRRRTQGTAAA